MDARVGTTIDLSALGADASRSARNRELKRLETALRADGWVRVVDARLDGPTSDTYAAAESLFADSAVCAAHRRDVLETSLALTFLGDGEEPLYDAAAHRQHVHSWNMHEVLSAEECDARLDAGVSEEERALAHAYHSWPATHAQRTQPLRVASAALRRALCSFVCEPLLRAFALLLGLDERWLISRCTMSSSDNTSLLRCLEYPRLDHDEHTRADDDQGAVWGVSVHTDFEVFSLLHEQVPGLSVQDPRGVWHSPMPAGAVDAGSAPAGAAWILIIGDMLDLLSTGYLRATPRVPCPAPPSHPRPRTIAKRVPSWLAFSMTRCRRAWLCNSYQTACARRRRMLPRRAAR